MKKNRKQLSSPMTPFWKFVFPSLWIGGFGNGTFQMAANGHPEWPGFLLATIAGATFLWWGCFRLKKVYIETDTLVISNYIKTDRVPLSEMQDVKENRLINLNPVWLHLKNESKFGRKIMFIPPLRFNLFFTHPLVEELRKMIMYRVDRI